MIEKHGRPVVVVLSVEEYEKMSGSKTEDNSEDGDAGRRNKGEQ